MQIKSTDLSKFLDRAKNRIHRVGIELEGGWDKLPPGINELVHDGSVRISAPADPNAPAASPEITPAQMRRFQELHHRRMSGRDLTGGQRVEYEALSGLINGVFISAPVSKIKTGEIPLGPQPVEEKGKKYLETVEKTLKIHWPQHVNETCGMHVHMSFLRALNYQRIMKPEYPATVRAYFNEWAKAQGLSKGHYFWPRLRGESRYCQHKFHADAQAMRINKDHDHSAEGHRYTDINYCFLRNGTVECRLLPMFETFDLSMSAIRELLRVTNAFLLSEARREDKLVASIIDGGDDVREETIECV